MQFQPGPLFLLVRRLVRSVELNGLHGAVVHSYERLFRSLAQHGVGGTFQRAFVKAPVAPRRVAPELPHPFDLARGIDTGGYISGAEMPAISLSALYTTAYLGIAPTALTQALVSLPFPADEFTFVDVGCGKGRALIVAAQFPFRRLVGVEIVPGLCEVARRNVAKNPGWAARTTITNEDAAAVTFPDGPLLLFLFDPFLAPVLRKVLINLERQLRFSPRTAYVLYAKDPHYQKVMDEFPYMKQVYEAAFPLSADDTEHDPFRRTQERFTLYRAELPR